MNHISGIPRKMTSSGKILDLGQNRKMNYIYLGFTLLFIIIYIFVLIVRLLPSLVDPSEN